MFGKIIDNKLVFAGKIIKTETGTISNPTEVQLIANSWKEVVYNEKPTYDIEEEKLVEVYEDSENIIVSYEKVALTNKEHNAVIKQEIEEEENKIEPRQYREGIKDLKDGKTSSYAFDKIEEINSNIEVLRAKLIK